ncbi:MAG TPA: succinate dehydrogenase, cytochrome b556 subunit [Gammaproteobacteria bacterium]|nr:succinate dehydrogenase, cytochrome b556 subunit [Gammaproteobacteria bacterium]
MKTADRPLSPHLQIYKWPLTMATSIMHRASGMWLSIGSAALVFWLICAALGPDSYAIAQSFFHSGWGIALLMLWAMAFFYHLCNGIRHLFWDAGKGFDIHVAHDVSWVVIGIAAACTIVTWIFGFIVMGGGA